MPDEDPKKVDELTPEEKAKEKADETWTYGLLAGLTVLIIIASFLVGLEWFTIITLTGSYVAIGAYLAHKKLLSFALGFILGTMLVINLMSIGLKFGMYELDVDSTAHDLKRCTDSLKTSQKDLEEEKAVAKVDYDRWMKWMGETVSCVKASNELRELLGVRVMKNLGASPEQIGLVFPTPDAGVAQR